MWGLVGDSWPPRPAECARWREQLFSALAYTYAIATHRPTPRPAPHDTCLGRRLRRRLREIECVCLCALCVRVRACVRTHVCADPPRTRFRNGNVAYFLHLQGNTARFELFPSYNVSKNSKLSTVATALMMEVDKRGWVVISLCIAAASPRT